MQTKTIDEYIYNLLTQILDPCRILIYSETTHNDGNLDVITKSFEKIVNVKVNSIVTQNGKIFDLVRNKDITGDGSDLLTSNLFRTQLFELIKNSIAYFDSNNHRNVSNNNCNNSYSLAFLHLSKNSLYFWNLLQQSTSIPSEVVDMENFEYFQIYSVRTLNQTINITKNDVSFITLPNQGILKQGRDSFASFYMPFDSIDFVAIRINLNVQTELECNINDNHNNIANVNNVDQATLIHVLSNLTYNGETTTIPLDTNISITFDVPNDVSTISSDLVIRFACVWYNTSENEMNIPTDTQWSDAGVSQTLISKVTKWIQLNANVIT